VLKLIDFGFSKHFREGKMMKSHKGMPGTNYGFPLWSFQWSLWICSLAPSLHRAGTLSFMAPEVLQHQWLDVRAR
jgi:serine/threonine protein kinase